MTSTPLVSLILSCSTIERQVRSAIEYIQQTQPVGEVELFIVCWEGNDFSSLANGFFSATAVTFPKTSGLKVGIVQAIRRATAEILVLLEDHTRQKTNSLGYGRRLLYAFVIPLKVLIRWAHLLKTPRDPAFFPRGVVLRNALGITIELSASALGEMCSYLFGTAKSHLRLTEVEVGSDRLRK